MVSEEQKKQRYKRATICHIQILHQR